GITAIGSLMLLILCTTGLFVLAHHMGGYELVNSVWQAQIYGRVNEEGGHHNFYYYLLNGLVNYAPSFPLALLVMFGLRKHLKQMDAEHSFLRSLAGWFLVILIGLSIPMDKHARYIVALTPAAALLAAYPFINQISNVLLDAIKHWMQYFCKTLPWIAF